MTMQCWPAGHVIVAQGSDGGGAAPVAREREREGTMIVSKRVASVLFATMSLVVGCAAQSGDDAEPTNTTAEAVALVLGGHGARANAANASPRATRAE
jgi:hypothetical protein